MAPVDTEQPLKKTASRDPHAPVTFSLEQIPRLDAPKTRRYWIGVMEDAPFDADSRGGIAMMKYMGPPPVDDDGQFNPAKIQARGQVVELTEEQLALFVKRVANVVLTVGHVTSDSVDPKTGKPRSRFVVKNRKFLDSVEYDVQKDRRGEAQTPRTFKFDENDVPLGYYVYCVPIRELMPENWRSQTPPRMCNVPSMVKGA